MKKLILISIILIIGCGTEPQDCAGVAGGTAEEDACGVCEGDGSSCSLTVTDIDGNVYETVQIGDQLWMAENLKTTKYNNGDEIPTGYSNSEWAKLRTDAYAVYDDDSSNVEVYGNLYNWYTVDDTMGVCPEGWHVPTDDEWTILIDYLGETSEAVGGKMKSTGTIRSSLESNEDGGGLWTYFSDEITEKATNESGFTGLPAGYRSSSIYAGGYYNMGTNASFWSSSEESRDSYSAWQWRLYYYGSNVGHEYYYKYFGFSIRCVAD